ncbi:hypothetical protein EOL94_00820 [bacterium]|nr:hypothetical protein [bacterium]
MVNKKKKKIIGLALGSGGARGFAHIGVIQALDKEGIEIGAVSGTSIGSLVASYYALNKEVEGLTEKALKIMDNNIFRFLETNFKGGFLSQDKIRKALYLIFKNKNFSDTKIPLKILTTNLVNGQPNIIDKGRIVNAVQTSCAVPLVFGSVKKENKILVDGAISEPVPVNVLKETKADVILAINLYHENEFIKKKFNLATTALRSNKVLLHHLAKEKCKEADVSIDIDLSKQINSSSVKYMFSKKEALDAIEIGRKSIKENIKEIKKALK